MIDGVFYYFAFNPEIVQIELATLAGLILLTVINKF